MQSEIIQRESVLIGCRPVQKGELSLHPPHALCPDVSK